MSMHTLPRQSSLKRLYFVMHTAKELLDQQFFEMRWRCLSLAADLDRLQNAPDGADLLKHDPRLSHFFAALEVLTKSAENRAEQVQMLFSDQSE